MGPPALADKKQGTPTTARLEDLHLDNEFGTELIVSTCDLGSDMIETIERVSEHSENIKLRTYSTTYHSLGHVKLNEESCNLVCPGEDLYERLQGTLDRRRKW